MQRTQPDSPQRQASISRTALRRRTSCRNHRRDAGSDCLGQLGPCLDKPAQIIVLGRVSAATVVATGGVGYRWPANPLAPRVCRMGPQPSKLNVDGSSPFARFSCQERSTLQLRANRCIDNALGSTLRPFAATPPPRCRGKLARQAGAAGSTLLRPARCIRRCALVGAVAAILPCCRATAGSWLMALAVSANPRTVQWASVVR